MNFAVTFTWMLLAALLQLSAVKTASINKGGEKEQNEVTPFLEVYNKSLCQVREVLVDIYQEYPENTELKYIPAFVVVERCEGYCGDEALQCVPTATHNVTMAVMMDKERVSQHLVHLSFTAHRACECRVQKTDVKAKKE